MNTSSLRLVVAASAMLFALSACGASEPEGVEPLAYRILQEEAVGPNRRNLRVRLNVGEIPSEGQLRATAERVRRSGNEGLDVLRVWLFLPGMDSTSGAYAIADYRGDRLHDFIVNRVEGAAERRLTGQAGEPVSFSFTLVPSIRNERVAVEGSTDLPDGAVIAYEVRLLDDSFRFMEEGETEVRAGRFVDEVSIRGWPRGQVEVWAGFLPVETGRSQPAELMARVGELGENLEGHNVTGGSVRRIQSLHTLTY